MWSCKILWRVRVRVRVSGDLTNIVYKLYINLNIADNVEEYLRTHVTDTTS